MNPWVPTSANKVAYTWSFYKGELIKLIKVGKGYPLDKRGDKIVTGSFSGSVIDGNAQAIFEFIGTTQSGRGLVLKEGGLFKIPVIVNI